MSPTFFTDRDLGKRFPDILRSAGLVVERHADHFRPETPDEDWLAVVGSRGWTALTHDGRIRYKRNERDAVIAHNVGLLVIIGAVPHAELANAFVATLPRIGDFLAKHQPPFIAKVYRPSQNRQGRVELWYP